MAIRGFVERVSRNAISGWCIDTPHGEVVDVEIRVGPVVLTTVHADIYRRDLREKWGCSVGGFNFRISPRLFALLPPREKVEVWAMGRPLQFTKTCDSHIGNPDGEGIEELQRLLADGYLVSAKSGGVFRPVAQKWSVDRIFNELDRLNEEFQKLFSKSLFICYGTLLGCIRNGDFIAHDDDVDVCFVADGIDAESAAGEFRHVVDTLKGNGVGVRWAGGGHFHWETLDVFIAWFEDGGLYMYNAGGKLSKDRVLPLQAREFKGREVLVPHDSGAVLELIYGANWRTPDPMFQWRVPDETRQKLSRFSERLSTWWE